MELEKILCRLADAVGREAIGEVGHECTEKDSNGNYIAKLKIVETKMTAKTKKDWTNTMFIVNIGLISFAVGVIVGQFVKVVL